MRISHILYITATIGLAGCAGTPGPGDAGYAYNVDGLYRGRLVVEGAPFDGTLDLRMARNGRVSGNFNVRAPLEIDGSVSGTVVDDLLRLTLTYESAARAGARGPCESRIEGLLTVAAGGGSIEGPVTVTDCGDPLPGRMSFRR